jgi:ribose 1,5-bisphosphokinase
VSTNGTLFLIVGASGVGKDSLIKAARPHLLQHGFVFPRRWITSTADRGEDHVPVQASQFDEALQRGALDLHWNAYGLSYGIPASLHDDLSAGRHVLVNVSRTVIPQARARFARLCIVCIEAPADVLRARLLERGREGADEIEVRLQRARAAMPEGPEVVVFSNELPLAQSAALFVDTILEQISITRNHGPTPLP